MPQMRLGWALIPYIRELRVRETTFEGKMLLQYVYKHSLKVYTLSKWETVS